ncbi:hypothetical protein GGX14DRAFT_568191 [Mycena pura]|uniref:Uncharacterized protein n=1 Tax=Mycena pura TaxID=153505 RepID=A0AAD6YD60_9AGAR|nr:hypothetical protein GGX14DRAFT_568191 [Mycena pura]
MNAFSTVGITVLLMDTESPDVQTQHDNNEKSDEDCSPLGPLNRPDYNTNLRHRAILRKSIELYSPEHLEAIFRHPVKLRVKTGSVSAVRQMGKIYTHYVQNDHLISHETPIPDAEAQEELRAYCVGYDAYFMKKGNTYRIRNVHAKPAAQAAEQRWHDFMNHSLGWTGCAPSQQIDPDHEDLRPSRPPHLHQAPPSAPSPQTDPDHGPLRPPHLQPLLSIITRHQGHALPLLSAVLKRRGIWGSLTYLTTRRLIAHVRS